MSLDSEQLDPTQVKAIDAQASVLMKRGIRLMQQARPDSLPEILSCFDDARVLRRRLPVDTVPVFRYGLAACWLNRGEALMRLGDHSRIIEVLQAYDEGIALLRDLPMGEDPRFPRRLVIALQNRGLALQAWGGVHRAEAADAFAEAIAILDHDQMAGTDDRLFLRAGVSVNLASAYAAEATPDSDARACDEARRAVALVGDLEAHDAAAAEVGLTARHILCQTIAGRLDATPAESGTIPADIHEATDLADNGLALARQWEQKGITRLRPFAYDLFRFGARVYAKYQPHFLGEFVRDNLDPARSSADYVNSPAMRAAAREALDLVRGIEG
jgi:hypothetical protein